jgi:hypothetical protein
MGITSSSVECEYPQRKVGWQELLDGFTPRKQKEATTEV